jgi:hypothetical protein
VHTYIGGLHKMEEGILAVFLCFSLQPGLIKDEKGEAHGAATERESTVRILNFRATNDGN